MERPGSSLYSAHFPLCKTLVGCLGDSLSSKDRIRQIFFNIGYHEDKLTAKTREIETKIYMKIVSVAGFYCQTLLLKLDSDSDKNCILRTDSYQKWFLFYSDISVAPNHCIIFLRITWILFHLDQELKTYLFQFSCLVFCYLYSRAAGCAAGVDLSHQTAALEVKNYMANKALLKVRLNTIINLA